MLLLPVRITTKNKNGNYESEIIHNAFANRKYTFLEEQNKEKTKKDEAKTSSLLLI